MSDLARNLVLCLTIFGVGCSLREPEFVRRVRNVTTADIKGLFRQQTALSLGNDVRRFPVKKIMDQSKVVRGFMQEEIYSLRGDAEGGTVRMLVIFDERWYRRGFITGLGKGYSFDSRGEAVRLAHTRLYDNVKAILGISESISVVPYDGDDEPKKKPEGADSYRAATERKVKKAVPETGGSY